ncbi:MAG: tetratricopeptide repeat protein [Myxococcales bacterium]
MDDTVRELVALGKEHFQRGDWSLAAGHLEQVIARGAAFADVHHMLGVCYHQMGEFDPAQRAFERALEINPGYVEASLNLAILCNDLGQYEKAQNVYSNALSRSRNGAKATSEDEPLDAFTRGKIANLHASVGDAYLAARRPADAALEFRRALDLSPGFVDLRMKLASALRESGDAEGADAELRRAVRDAPAYVPARVALGLACSAGGKLDDAIEHWEEVLRMDPRHRTAQLYLKLARAQAPAAAGGPR